MNTKKLSRNTIMKIIFSVLIFVVSSRYIFDVYQPTLLDDEFAYIGVAKYFSGTTWSGMMSSCQYYSYGYSIFITPIVFLIKDTVVLYRAIIATNGVLLVFSYLILLNIFENIFNNKINDNSINKDMIAGISCLMILFPCYMNYSNVAMSECLLLLIFLIIIRRVISLNENTGTIASIVLGALLIYLYTIHQRMMGFVVAVVAAIFIMMLKKNIKKSTFAKILVTMCILLIVHMLIKTDLKYNLWLNGTNSDYNDTSLMMGRFTDIFTSFELFTKFIAGIFGKIYYAAAASYLFEVMGLVMMVTSGIIAYKKEKKVNYFGFIIVIGFILTLGISCVFLYNPSKLAYLIYGRYLEIFMPVVTGYCIINFISNFENKKKNLLMVMSGVGIFGVSGIVVRWCVNKYSLTWLNYMNNSQIYKYSENDKVPILKVMIIVICIMIGALISINVYKVLVVNKKRRCLIFIKIVMFCAVFGLFYTTASNPMEEINIPLQSERNETKEIKDQIIALKSDSIYYVSVEGEPLYTSQYREYLQYWLYDFNIKCIEADKLNQDINSYSKGDIFIVTNTQYDSLNFVHNENIKFICENQVCRIYQLK